MQTESSIHPSEHKTVIALYKCLQALESNPELAKSPQTLEKLGHLFSSLHSANSPAVKKLGELEKHLKSTVTVKTLEAMILPFERILDRTIDDSFFTPTKDYDTDFETLKDFRNKKIPLYLVLDNLRSAFNVGSIFRSAEACGVKKIYLLGYTPTPESQQVKKTAMGTCDLVDWEHLIDFQTWQNYQANQYPKAKVYCLEKSKAAKNIFLEKFEKVDDHFLIVGNERFGISQSTLQSFQNHLIIPMTGLKNSLNVANAISIASYEFKRQFDLKRI